MFPLFAPLVDFLVRLQTVKKRQEPADIERKLIEIAPVMLACCVLKREDREAVFTFVNPAIEAQLGWTNLVGKPLNTIVPSEYGGYHTWLGMPDPSLSRQVGMGVCPMAGHSSRVVDAIRPVQAVRKDGSLVDILLSVQILPKSTTGSRAFIGTMVDVSQLVAARRKAEALATEIETVNHVAAHDIKADLSALYKGSELICDLIKDFDADGLSDTNAAIADEISHFANLNLSSAGNAIDLLSQRAKLYDLPATIEVAACPVTEIVEALTATFGLSHGEFRIQNDTLPDTLIWIDKILVLSALNNLIRNGFAHNDKTENAQKVSISMKNLTSNMVEIKVFDNGPGIPPDYLAKWGTMLGKSAQIEASGDGSGVGLYSVRKIIEAHKNASIELANGPEGGTVCLMIFPES